MTRRPSTNQTSTNQTSTTTAGLVLATPNTSPASPCPAVRSLTGRTVVGIDTHRDTHYVAVIADGRVGPGREFGTDTAGLAALVEFAVSQGVTEAGVEGTSSYGQGVTGQLQQAGIRVVEASTVDKAVRRRRGKSDPVDAEVAAQRVWDGQATIIPKAHDGQVEQLRLVQSARELSVRQATQLVNHARATAVTAPPTLRDRLPGQTGPARFLRGCRDLRVRASDGPVGPTLVMILNDQARQWFALQAIIKTLTAQLEALVRQVCPPLLDERGVGPVSAAQLLITLGDNPDRVRSEAAFAMLTGTAPLPAASGLTSRYRLNRGGDRQANRALHMIIVVRSRIDPATKDYLARRQAAGQTKKMAFRAAKRYLARSLYRLITRHFTTQAAA